MSRTSRPGYARGAVGYGLASASANALGYAVTVLLARGLTAGQFGAIGALLAIGIVGTVPATALQLSVARRAATPGPGGSGINAGDAARHGLVVGLGIAAACAAGAWPLARYLHLDSALPVVIVGVTLVPMLVTAALQGVLLGEERLGGLSVSTLVTAGARVAAVPVGLVLGEGVLGVLVAIAIASAGSAAVTLALATNGGRDPVPLKDLLVRASHGTVTLTAYFVLTNADIPVARHQLAAGDSGSYVLGSLFAKICLWGPQFVSVVAFPHMRRGREGRAATLVASGVTAALGIGAAVLFVPLGAPVVRAVSGAEQPAVAELAPLFGLLGVSWAVLHTVALHEIATLRARHSWWLWIAAGVLVTAISLLPDPVDVRAVLLAALACSLLAAVIGVARVWFVRPDATGPDLGVTPASVALGNPVGAATEELLADRDQHP